MDDQKLKELQSKLDGELHYDKVMRTLYATDASAYREMPLAVSIPKSEKDLFELVNFARENKVSLIPRTAGTSLAGQVVGSGIVVDVSVNFREILTLLKKALKIYVHEGQERMREEEEYELYREQYPFDEYYHFKEEFKSEWK